MSEWTVKTAIEALNMTSQHETPTTWANRVVFALEALAREKADAVPSPARAAERLGRELVERYGPGEAPPVRDVVAEKHLESLRALETMTARAEAAEKERDEAKAARAGWETTARALGHERDAARAEVARLSQEQVVASAEALEIGRHTELVEHERDALRAERDALSRLHEQDKAELVRWRKAAERIRTYAKGQAVSLHVENQLLVLLDAAEKP